MRLSRRAFLFSSAGAMAGVPAYAKLLESSWLEVTEKTVPFRGFSRPLRLLHLSDLHCGDDTPLDCVAGAIRLGLSQRPDLACLTGDFITAGCLRDPGAYSAALKTLGDAVPSYASFGNHDGGRWTNRHGQPLPLQEMQRVIEAAGIQCLHNEAAVATAAGERISFTGIGDLWAHDMLPDRAFGMAAAGLPSIVLSHNPDTVRGLMRYPWDLLLAGHTHGGQVVVPMIGVAPYVPVQDRRFIRGLHELDGRYVHVTRGVGAILGLRFNCRPEVSILNLTPA